MEKRRNLCAHIPISLFNRVGAEREKAGLTNSEYVTGLLEEYFTMKDKGGNGMAQNNGETRTLAFQIPATLFQRIKDYLERESKRRGRKITQRDFVLGLIEQALDEADGKPSGRRKRRRDSPMGLTPGRNPTRTRRTGSRKRERTAKRRRRPTARRARKTPLPTA